MKLFHADPQARCSFDGQEYEADGDGSFDVPDHAAEALAVHGFSTSKADAPAPAADGSEDLVEMVQAAHEAGLELQDKLDAAEARVAELEAQLAARDGAKE